MRYIRVADCTVPIKATLKGANELYVRRSLGGRVGVTIRHGRLYLITAGKAGLVTEGFPNHYTPALEMQHAI